MEVHLTPETEHLSQEKPAALGQVRNLLDSRYDEVKSGRVKPIDGEEAFTRLRRKSDERRTRRSSRPVRFTGCAIT